MALDGDIPAFSNRAGRGRKRASDIKAPNPAQVPTNPASREEGERVVSLDSSWLDTLSRWGEVDKLDVLGVLALTVLSVTAGNTAVTMVDTAAPPRLKSSLPKRSWG